MGPLLQGRFKAHLVEKETYLLELARDIVLSRVRARRVPTPEAWRWSSYRVTAGIGTAPEWLTTDGLLRAVGGRAKAGGRKRYRAFVRKGMENREFEQAHPWARLRSGSEAFIQAMRERIEGRTGLEEVPKGQRFVGRPSLEQLFKDAGSKTVRDRHIREAIQRRGYRLKEIAAAEGLHHTSVSHIANAKANSK